MALSDLRPAIRSLRKQPGFTAVALATLALGIGANTAIFSVVHAVLLAPLPYPDADRLVRVRGEELGSRDHDNLSPLDFLDLRARAQRFERLAAYNNYADATLTGAGEPERVAGTRVTADFFAALHVAPMIGRDFRADDDRPDSAPVAVLSYGFWTRRFGSSPSIVGTRVQLNSVPTEILGVLPAWFRHPLEENHRQPDVFVPLRIDPKNDPRGGHYLQAIGLLTRGTSLADAAADLRGIAADLARTYPKSNTGRSVTIEPLLESIVGDTREPLYILLGAVSFVLLIACANLANLMLARSTTRRREIAVRQALGASRAQLVRQFLTESVVLSIAGGACGLVAAASLVRALAAVGAAEIPRGDSIAIDGVVYVFAFALSVATGLVFGVGPALAATRQQPREALQHGGRTGAAPSQGRLQRMLVAGEVALALMLLVAAGLLVKSLWKLSHVDPGFHAEQVLTLRTSLPLARYPEGDEIPFYQRLEARLAALPGIRTVGAVNILPLSSNYSCDAFTIDGRPPFAPGQEPCAENRSITPGYFDAMAIPLLRGRAFTRFDVEGAAPVAIVSDEMARRFWPGQDAIGARVRYRDSSRTIVGIVAGVKHFGLDRDAPFELYTPHAQQPSYHTMTLVLRTPLDADAVVPMVRGVLASIDRDIPISNVEAMQRVVSDSTADSRFRTLLLAAFAALAIVLALVGVSGVIAFSASRRTQEIGVRVALGATERRVTAMIVGQGLVPAALGAAAGLAGALALTRVLSGLLFGVSPSDPLVFGASAAALMTAALVA